MYILAVPPYANANRSQRRASVAATAAAAAYALYKFSIIYAPRACVP